MADGYIEFSTRLDNSDLEKQLKEAEGDVDRLKRKLEERESERNALVDALKAADAALKETEGNIEELKARYEELMAARDSGEMPAAYAEARMEAVTEMLAEQEKTYSTQLDAAHELAQMWEKNENEISQIPQELDEATKRANELGKQYSRAYGTAATTFNNGVKAMNKRFDAFTRSAASRVKSLFAFGAVLGLFSSLQGYIQESVESSASFTAAANNLKAVLAGIATPIINVVIPAFTAMVNVISAVLITLAKLVDSMFKTNFVGAIESARNSMAASQEAQEGATEATDADTAATKRNAKAKKEATRWLAAFDELNVMAKQDEGGDEGGGSPLGGIAPAGAGSQEPTWDGIDVGKIDQTLAEIMLIIGAALIAVGAILAFSGINIPIGLTLMVIGALMVYTAVTEQWDKLPAEVQDAINGALVFMGIVLIVIGLVLAFAAPEFAALGIGMIAAGALMLWTVVAINWDQMPADIQEAVNVIMGILSVALLVIGAILTFTAANPILGVGLMALGAAGLAGLAALNWDKMPDDVKQMVETIAEIVGVAFLVLGVILLISPTTTPLGVGLILIGAAALAMSIAAQWDKMPQEVRNMVSLIGAIVGAALLVLGIILIATGAGLPLGIALIIAGAGSLAAVVAVNFDAIKNKVKEIWAGLKSWFTTTVAPIFTVKYWQDMFKSIVNGLISALNSGLGAFGGFINELGSGVSDILNFFGVGGYSFSIGIPQIPYLAQGAVIPPNRRFMAVLGDQTNGTNLEAPESLIRQIVREESGNAQLLAVVMQILQAVQNGQTIECDGYTLAKVVNNRNATNRKIYGY